MTKAASGSSRMSQATHAFSIMAHHFRKRILSSSIEPWVW